MKKLVIVIISFMLMVFLTGCNEVRSEEDKQMFNEYFINQDNQNGYVQAGYYVEFTKDNIDYFYRHDFEFKEDGTIEIWNVLGNEQEQFLYTYKNDTLLFQKYDGIPYNQNSNLLKEEESFITKEDFLNTYEIFKNPKYNLEFSKADYYRKSSFNMDGPNWYHYLKFNKEYIYKFQIFDFILNLNKCKVLFETGQTELDTNMISGIDIVGYENHIEYKLHIYIER